MGLPGVLPGSRFAAAQMSGVVTATRSTRKSNIGRGEVATTEIVSGMLSIGVVPIRVGWQGGVPSEWRSLHGLNGQVNTGPRISGRTIAVTAGRSAPRVCRPPWCPARFLHRMPLMPRNRFHPERRLSTAAAVSIAFVLAAACARAPDPAVPANLDGLDPAVAELIHRQLRILEDNPRDGAAHGELGLMYAANKIWDPAREAFATATSLDDDYLWRYYYAIASEQGGDIETAITLFEDLAASHREFAPAFERLGDLQLANGDVVAAQATFGRIVELEPDSPEGYAGLGEALLAGGDADRAVGTLLQALDRDPTDRSAHHILGNAYRRLGRATEAAQHLTLGTPANRTFLPDPYTERLDGYRVNLTDQLERGVALMMAGDTGAAVRVFSQTLEYHPDNLTVLNNLAIALMRQNQLEESRAVLERALAVDDRKFSTYSNLASWALRSRQPQLALDFAEQAVERAPDRFQTYLLQCRILLSMNRFGEAADAFTKSIELNYRNVDAHVFLGEALIRMQRWEEARESFEVALEVNPQQLRAHAGLVRVGLADGQTDMAARHLEVLKLYTPDHPEVRHYQEQLDAATQ